MYTVRVIRLSDELDLLKRRKLIELQRKILLESAKREKKPTREEIDPIEFIREHFVGRANEVFSKALSQYPVIAKYVAHQLAKLIMAGKIDKIDGVTLYEIFRALGYPVRLETKIVYKSRGKVKTLSELLREKCGRDT